jgi:hypothetical protein
VLLQNRLCQPCSTSSVTEGVAVHSTDTPRQSRSLSWIDLKNNIAGMFVSVHFAFAVVLYIALTMLTGIFIV